MNKQNLWFFTLFSLILILGAYYITMPNSLLEKVAEEQFAMWHTINKAEAEYNKFVQHMEKIEND